MISFEDGARITGSGFVVYRGAGARLERALINFLLNTQTVENGYQEVGVPFVVKRECMEGTGQLPKFEEDMYGTEDQQMFLIPTAEVPVTNLYRDTILQESDPAHQDAGVYALAPPGSRKRRPHQPRYDPRPPV